MCSGGSGSPLGDVPMYEPLVLVPIEHFQGLGGCSVLQHPLPVGHGVRRRDEEEEEEVGGEG